jgi:hypothetical protein
MCEEISERKKRKKSGLEGRRAADHTDRGLLDDDACLKGKRAA